MAVTDNTLQQQLTAFGFHANVLLLADGSKLEIHHIVRTVPGRRLVCKGVWNSQNVYAKIFVGRSAERYADRDASGVVLLDMAGIATPSLLCVGELVDKQARVLVFEEISDVVNAEQYLLTLNAEAKFKLAVALVQAVAAHHQHQLIQTDLYLKNFLVKANKVYTLDGDGIRPLSGFCLKRRKLENLATLLSKFDVLDDGWIKALYVQYCAHAGVANIVSDELKLNYLTQKIRHLQAISYADKKVFRTCTDVKVIQNFISYKAISSSFEIENIDAQLLDDFLANPERNIKNGNTCTVGIAQLANKKTVVKRYNIKNFWHGLNRAFRVSRASQSWANAHRLIISNIATAQPLALIEERRGVLRRRAYYLSEYVDAPDVAQFFAQSTNFEDKQIVAHNLAVLLYKLYLLKFTHGDFKASNIKIVNLEPVLIDLDAMKAHQPTHIFDWLFEHKHVKDLKRFMKNWEHDMETANLLKQALQLAYASQDPNGGDAILIRAGIA